MNCLGFVFCYIFNIQRVIEIIVTDYDDINLLYCIQIFCMRSPEKIHIIKIMLHIQKEFYLLGYRLDNAVI